MGFGGGSQGSGSIASSSDVSLNNAVNADLLSYNSSTQKWRNAQFTTPHLDVIYTGGAYPTQASSAPAGVKIRHFYGPVAYSGASWAGVIDLYTYVDV